MTAPSNNYQDLYPKSLTHFQQIMGSPYDENQASEIDNKIFDLLIAAESKSSELFKENTTALKTLAPNNQNIVQIHAKQILQELIKDDNTIDPKSFFSDFQNSETTPPKFDITLELKKTLEPILQKTATEEKSHKKTIFSCIALGLLILSGGFAAYKFFGNAPSEEINYDDKTDNLNNDIDPSSSTSPTPSPSTLNNITQSVNSTAPNTILPLDRKPFTNWEAYLIMGDQSQAIDQYLENGNCQEALDTAQLIQPGLFRDEATEEVITHPNCIEDLKIFQTGLDLIQDEETQRSALGTFVTYET